MKVLLTEKNRLQTEHSELKIQVQGHIELISKLEHTVHDCIDKNRAMNSYIK